MSTKPRVTTPKAPALSGIEEALRLDFGGPGANGARITKTTVLSVRVNPEERAILEAASEQARTSLSEFVRRKAVEAAELEMMERRVVTIPAEHWEAFEAWANRPPQDIPALRELAGRKPTWRR
jgi:uncharacterized protein (DUF1778 family)